MNGRFGQLGRSSGTALLMLLALGGYAYQHYQSAPNRSSTAKAQLTSVPAGREFGCRGKVYCSEMRSCAEAMFYQRHCPGTRMDGDRDGIPCERQWCGH